MVILYTTPTCAPCRVAKKQLEAAGVAHEVIDLTRDPAALEALKSRSQQPILQTPILERAGQLYTIADLPNLIAAENG